MIEAVRKNLRTHLYLSYTLLFLLLSVGIFTGFILRGSSFIGTIDGRHQHLKALIYYSRYLRAIARNILSGSRPFVPQWEHAIGEGSDILGTLHFYCIGDPVAFLAALVPERYTALSYTAAQFLRLWLSGLAFLLLCREVLPEARQEALLSGSLLYAFSFWGLTYVDYHPFFLTPLICFPLLLLGIERILRGRSPSVFVLSVAVTLISNFYFFYISGMLSAVYAAVRLLLMKDRDVRQRLRLLLALAAGAALGMALGGVILLPQLWFFLRNPRMDTRPLHHFFEDAAYYLGLPGDLLSNEKHYYGAQAPALTALLLLFGEKGRHRSVKVLTGISFCILIFPYLAIALHGFAHKEDRWCFALSLLFSFLVVLMWEDFFRIGERELKLLLTGFGVTLILILLPEESRSVTAFLTLAANLLITLVLTALPRLRPEREPAINAPGASSERGSAVSRGDSLLLSFVLLGVLLTGWKTFSGPQDTLSMDHLNATVRTSAATAVREAAEEDGATGFFRYSGATQLNSGFLPGMSSTSFYWSTVTPWGAALRSELSVSNHDLYTNLNYDARTALNAIMGVRYYITDTEEEQLPYGYTPMGSRIYSREKLNAFTEDLRRELGTDTLTDTETRLIRDAAEKRVFVYRNEYALPVGFVYDRVLSPDLYRSLSAPEKEAAFLQAVCLDTEESDPLLSSMEISHEVTGVSELPWTLAEADEGIFLRDPLHFTVSKPYSRLNLDFEGVPGSETYFVENGMDFREAGQYELYFGDDSLYDPDHSYSRTAFRTLSVSDRKDILKDHFLHFPSGKATLRASNGIGAPESLAYRDRYNKKYSGRDQFILNLGYHEEADQRITLTFPDPGIYSFDSFRIHALSMDDYPERIAALKKHPLEQVVMTDNTILGQVTLERPGALFLSIPYSPGWSASADGEALRVYRANEMFMAVLLPEGTHHITFSYHTPWLRAGMLLSLAGLLISACLLLKSSLFKQKRNMVPCEIR